MVNNTPTDTGVPGDPSRGHYTMLAHMVGVAVVGTVWTWFSKKEEEKTQRLKAMLALVTVEEALMQRQMIWCSSVEPRSKRVKIEKELIRGCKGEVLAAEGGGDKGYGEAAQVLSHQVVNLEQDLEKIFQDKKCARYGNKDLRLNGGIMWEIISNWRKQICKGSDSPGSMLGAEDKSSRS